MFCQEKTSHCLIGLHEIVMWIFHDLLTRKSVVAAKNMLSAQTPGADPDVSAVSTLFHLIFLRFKVFR